MAIKGDAGIKLNEMMARGGGAAVNHRSGMKINCVLVPDLIQAYESRGKRQ
jgi:hypothetical protein